MTLEDFLKNVGQNVAKFRKSNSMTQTKAAEVSKISYRYYQSIESGAANITVSTLIRLAQSLNVHPCDLLPVKPLE